MDYSDTSVCYTDAGRGFRSLFYDIGPCPGCVLRYLDWILEHGNIAGTNSSGEELVIILTESSGGIRLASTRYMHYGTITVRHRKYNLID